jgi:diguanylate cyclase (GGDEF)-like protein/PAS domain S-box-containing protein
VLTVLACITTQHDLRLVALAACLCAIACVTTLTLLARACATVSRASAVWMGAAAAVFGAGVWSLHFVAMLAFMPGLPIAYDVPATIASIAIAIAGTALAFALWQIPRSRSLGALIGGITLGLAVSAMHYAGISAMRLAGTLSLNKAQVVASILVGIAFGILALARAGAIGRIGRRAEVSVWLALCVCGVHFTGMSAMVIVPGAPLVLGSAMLGSQAMGAAVGSVSLAILLLSLGAALMDQHLAGRAVRELDRSRKLSNLSREVIIIHRNFVVLEINSAGERLFGMKLKQLLGSRLTDLFANPDIEAILAPECAPPDGIGTTELTAREPDGQLVPVEYTSSAIEYGGRPAMALSLRDLTDRRRDEDRIRHLAHHDALTDLPNRLLLNDRLGHALETAAREAGAVAVLYLDLDRFKLVNDLLGHACGDALLNQVARRLQAVLRSADTLARVGGDEFVIVSTLAAQPERAADLAGRVVQVLERPFTLAGRQMEIGVSVGIALYPADGGTQESLLHAADTALYRVKEERSGTFRFYEPTMDANLQDRHRLEQDLRRAVDRGELELHYQPVVNCRTMVTEGYEALVRWRHPLRGLVAPGDFIPLAEQTGQIDKIGKWVIQTACREAAGWADQCWVAVNVSAIQLRRSDLPQIVAAALLAAHLPARRLGIEVTESVFINDGRQAIKVLSAVRAQGVHISLDDFGTGYSSLSYLRSFAFNKIKIDKSFIAGLGQGDEAATIVRAIIGLGHNLAVSIVAEGIETPRQLAILRTEGCDYVQGYLLGRPALHPTPSIAHEPGHKRHPGLSVVPAQPRPHAEAS